MSTRDDREPIESGRGGNGAGSSRPALSLMPDGLFGRLLVIVLACVILPHLVALMIAPEDLSLIHI